MYSPICRSERIGLGHHRRGELEVVNLAGPDPHLGRHARRGQPARRQPRVVQQHLGARHVDQRARQARLDVVQRLVDLFGLRRRRCSCAAALGDQLEQRVESLGREHRIGLDVGVRLLGFLGQLQQRRDRHQRRGLLALLLQPLRQRQRQVAARGVAGQHDLVRLVSAQPQPAVARRGSRRAPSPTECFGHQPVIDHQHGRVGELAKALRRAGRASWPHRSETRRRACRAITRRVPSAGSTPGARTSCADAVGQLRRSRGRCRRRAAAPGRRSR